MFCFSTGHLTGIFIGIFCRFISTFGESFQRFFSSQSWVNIVDLLFSIIMTGHIMILPAIFDNIYFSTVLISWQFQKLNFWWVEMKYFTRIFFILPLTEFWHISLTVKSTSECSFDLKFLRIFRISRKWPFWY